MRRAVVDAMPLLIRAKDVVVAIADSGELDCASQIAVDVKQFLAKHGVVARAEVIDARNDDPAEALLQVGREIEADLIVLGGYGHSRVREMAFGGVTRSVLQSGSLHRLISN